ncbi:restriction endonuclease subunit S [Fervidobacterium riparium]|nr:restriction endonuclease subunit S [Fervidobacterium riparium]
MSENVKLPDGWQKVKLSEIIEEVKERNITNNKEYPILTSSRKGIYIQEEYFNRVVASENLSNYKIIRKNEFTYRSMSDDQTFVFNRLELLEVGLVSPAYYVFKAKNSLSTFIKYFLNNSQEIKSQISKVIEGTTRTALRFNQVLKFVAMVPPLPEQRKIAEILETIDNAIEKTDAIIEKYKRIKQGLMQDLFTKGVVSEGAGERERWRLRDENIDKFKDSPLGRIPEGWKWVKLGEVITFIKGKVPNKLSNIQEHSMVIYLSPEYLRGNINETFFCSVKNVILADNDIIILFDGSNAGEIFFAEKGAIASTMAKVDIQTKFIHKIFLYYVLKSYERLIKSQIKGSGIPHVEKNIFELLFAPLPPLPEQRKIAEILETIDNAIEKTDAIKEKLERIKKGLMEDLLTGKVRVNHLIEEEEK